MSKTFRHSGDLGDIIYSLPAVRALGGGVLYLDPQGGRSSRAVVRTCPRGHTRLNAADIESLAPLLREQTYIQDVRPWHGEAVDYDLDTFRCFDNPNLWNIADAHLAAFGLPLDERNRPWLTVRDPITIPDRKIVFSRSVRYHGNHCFWETAIEQLQAHAVFVGLPKEYEIFVYTFGCAVPHFPTPDILTLARVLAGAGELIVNQNLTRAIGEGLKMNLTTEFFRVNPNTFFERENARYV
jgi:hypothetical protein